MRKMLAPLAALALSACGTLAPAAPAAYQWDEPAVRFTYSHAGAPHGMRVERVEAALIDAARQWSQACGVRIEYAGQAEDSTNTVRWVQGFTDARVMGTASIAVVDGSTRIAYFTMALNAAKLTDSVKLHSTVLHEFGHVMGIDHSENAGAVMYRAARGRTELADEDINRCRR